MSFTLLAFLGFYVGLLVLALGRNPIFGLYAYLLAYYGHPPGSWWGDPLPDVRWSLIAAIVTLIGTLRVKKDESQSDWYADTPTKLLIAFSIWLWIQHLWARDLPEQTILAVLYTKYIVLFFLMFRILTDIHKLQAFLFAHVVGGAYFGWRAMGADVGGRVQGVGGPALQDANAFATHLAVLLFFAAGLLLGTRGVVRWIVLASAALIANGVVTTYSRSAFVAILCGGLVFLYLKPPQSKKVVYGLLVLAVLGFLAIGQDRYWERMSTILFAVDNSEETVVAKPRTETLRAQFKMLKVEPFGGLGHRGTMFLSGHYIDAAYLTGKRTDGGGRRSSHNTTMTILVEHGVPGTILMIILGVWFVRTTMKLKRLDAMEGSQGVGLLRASLCGACVALLAAAQFVDYIRIETPVTCVALLVVLCRVSGEGSTTGPASASTLGASKSRRRVHIQY